MAKALFSCSRNSRRSRRTAGYLAIALLGCVTTAGVGTPTADAETTSQRNVVFTLASSENYLGFDAKRQAIQTSVPARFDVLTTEAGYAQLKELASGRCLTAPKQDDRARPRLERCAAGRASQHWKVAAQIAARGSGKVLDAYNNWVRSGDPVVLYPNTGARNQTWTMKPSTRPSDDAPTPDVPASDAPTGHMPTQARPGFAYLSGEDFLTPAAAGKVASPEGDNTPRTYNKKLLAYGDWKGNSGGTYKFQENVSVHDGYLDVQVRTLNGEPTGAAWIFRHPKTGGSFTYGALEQRIRFVGKAPSYGTASLLWPANNVWGEGEIDFPEGGFGSQNRAYHHCLGARPQDNCSVFDTGVSWSDWHIYRIEWTPAGTSYFVDGHLIGKNTDATPTTPHNWVTQMALHGLTPKEQQAVPPIAQQRGNYQVDWARFEAYIGK